MSAGISVGGLRRLARRRLSSAGGNSNPSVAPVVRALSPLTDGTSVPSTAGVSPSSVVASSSGVVMTGVATQYSWLASSAVGTNRTTLSTATANGPAVDSRPRVRMPTMRVFMS